MDSPGHFGSTMRQRDFWRCTRDARHLPPHRLFLVPNQSLGRPTLCDCREVASFISENHAILGRG